MSQTARQEEAEDEARGEQGSQQDLTLAEAPAADADKAPEAPPAKAKGKSKAEAK